MSVPAEAITAAAEAIHRNPDRSCPCVSAEHHEQWLAEDRETARAVLEAAAPHLAAAIPSLIVKFDGELSPEQIEQLKHDWREAVRDRTQWPKLRLDEAEAETMLNGQAQRIAELEQLVTTQAAKIEECSSLSKRCAELDKLARDMRDTFAKASDGYRARTGQVTIARWDEILDGQK